MNPAATASLIVLCILVGACTNRPLHPAFSDPGVRRAAGGSFDGVYAGEGTAATCVTPDGESATYDAPVIAGVVTQGRFAGNLDGCLVDMTVYADGTVRGWTYIRSHRFVPLTYSLFDGQVSGDTIVGQFDQITQNSTATCNRGSVTLSRLDPDAVPAEAGETIGEVIEYYSPSTRCRTGGIQFP